MSTVANDGVPVDAGAGDFAFRAGQLVEELLLDRGTEVARSTGASVVTVEHVRPCIDNDFLDQLRVQLDERAKQKSREAA